MLALLLPQVATPDLAPEERILAGHTKFFSAIPG
jgi:hypothetical protein